MLPADQTPNNQPKAAPGPSVTSTVPVSPPLGGGDAVSVDKTTDAVYGGMSGDGQGGGAHMPGNPTSPRTGLHG